MVKTALTIIKKYPKTTTTFAVVVLLGSTLFGVISFMNFKASLDVRLRASALAGGEYRNALEAFVKVVNTDSLNYKVRMQNVNSPDASSSTLDQLQRGDADIGMCQSNAKRNSRDVAAVAYLYDEPYILITNKTGIQTISDIAKSLDTFRVAILPRQTQTYHDFGRLLRFYGIDSLRVRRVPMNYSDAREALASRTVDFGFFIIGLGNASLQSMVKNKEMHLVELENLEGYLLQSHKINQFMIPEGIFGLDCPPHDYPTLATKSMLVVQRSLDPTIVYEITKVLFEKESEISNVYPFLHLQPISNAADNYIPLHPGAEKYYKKNEPGFFDRNSNLIDCLLSAFGVVLAVVALVMQQTVTPKETYLKPAHLVSGQHAPGK